MRSCQGGGISSLRALPERAAHRGTVVEFISKSYECKKILEDISFEVKNSELVTPFAPTGEGLNFASAFDLPVIFMIENNHYAVSTRVEWSFRNCDPACKGPAYGMPGIAIDGNDAATVYFTTKQAVERARNGEGPTLIEAKTYRHGGHHINDPGLYMDQKVLAEWKERDPLKLLRNKIENKNEMKKIEVQEDKDLDEAIKV